MKRIYLSGPMTGLPGLNFAAFHAMTTNLRAGGHTVTNPAEINPDGGTWNDWAGSCRCMRTSGWRSRRCMPAISPQRWA